MRHFTSETERAEAGLKDSQVSANGKENENMLARLKGELESQKAAGQEWETKGVEAVQELRAEEAKLVALQEQFDQLDKILEQSSRQPGSSH